MQKIKFRELGNSNAISCVQDKMLVESSFAGDTNAIGSFRLPGVANGRYESRHPIENAAGQKIGALVKGVDRIGYTYACIYSDRAGCFFIAHCPFSAVWGSRSGHDSFISIVEATGEFTITGNGRKFEPTTTLPLPAGFVDNPEIYKTMNDGENLLYVSKKGITFLDLFRRSVASTIPFEELAYSTVGFAISPKVNILAVAFSNHNSEDPLTGDWRYRNFVRLYLLDQGAVIGEQELPTNEHKVWNLQFGIDGRSLIAASGDVQCTYELQS